MVFLPEVLGAGSVTLTIDSVVPGHGDDGLTPACADSVLRVALRAHGDGDVR